MKFFPFCGLRYLCLLSLYQFLDFLPKYSWKKKNHFQYLYILFYAHRWIYLWIIARIVISMNMVARTRNKSAARTEDRIYLYLLVSYHINSYLLAKMLAMSNGVGQYLRRKSRNWCSHSKYMYKSLNQCEVYFWFNKWRWTCSGSSTFLAPFGILTFYIFSKIFDSWESNILN